MAGGGAVERDLRIGTGELWDATAEGGAGSEGGEGGDEIEAFWIG